MLLRLQCNSSYKLNLKGTNEYGRNRTRMVWFRGEEQ